MSIVNKAEPYCEKIKAKCGNYYSCRMLKGRFNIEECNPRRKQIVEKKSIEEREKYLKKVLWSERKDELIRND